MRTKRRMAGILAGSILLSGILFLTDGNKKVSQLIRDGYGGDDRTEEVLVSVDGVMENEPVQIDVHSQSYSREELQAVFDKSMELLDQVVLGENESFDRIEQDMNLVKSVEAYGISVQWELDSYDILDTSGMIVAESLSQDGELVEIRGTLTYKKEQAVYIRTVQVFPKTKTEKEEILDKLQDEIEENDKKEQEKKELSLPETVEGEKVSWHYPASKTPFIILCLGIVVAALMPFLDRQKKREEEKKKTDQMLRDYAGIVSDFTLLSDTGMPSKQVLERMVRRYEERRDQENIRYAYEELKETFYEMQGGVPEGEAYERFGERCGIGVYRKFAALLAQNLKKGTRGLTGILEMEVIQANEEQKAEVRKRAEEAGTKLLIPMFVMLGVVMAIVLVPAFLSMNI